MEIWHYHDVSKRCHKHIEEEYLSKLNHVCLDNELSNRTIECHWSVALQGKNLAIIK